MFDWWLFYSWFSVGILWVLVFAFSYYFYTVMRADVKVLDFMYATVGWTGLLVATVLVTVYALWG
jgi:hypothetical protein